MQHFIFGSIVCFITVVKLANDIVSHLPQAIHTGLSFFEACLEEKVIVVPGNRPIANVEQYLTSRVGLFFDINPRNRRDLSHSPCHHFIRYNCNLPFLTRVSLLGPRLKSWRGDLMGLRECLSNMAFTRPRNEYRATAFYSLPYWILMLKKLKRRILYVFNSTTAL